MSSSREYSIIIFRGKNNMKHNYTMNTNFMHFWTMKKEFKNINKKTDKKKARLFCAWHHMHIVRLLVHLFVCIISYEQKAQLSWRAMRCLS